MEGFVDALAAGGVRVLARAHGGDAPGVSATLEYLSSDASDAMDVPDACVTITPEGTVRVTIGTQRGEFRGHLPAVNWLLRRYPPLENARSALFRAVLSRELSSFDLQIHPDGRDAGWTGLTISAGGNRYQIDTVVSGDGARVALWLDDNPVEVYAGGQIYGLVAGIAARVAYLVGAPARAIPAGSQPPLRFAMGGSQVEGATAELPRGPEELSAGDDSPRMRYTVDSVPLYYLNHFRITIAHSLVGDAWHSRVTYVEKLTDDDRQ